MKGESTMENFVKEFKAKKMDKEERIDYILDNHEEWVEFFKKKSKKKPEVLEGFFKKMADVKVAKSFLATVKYAKKEGIDLDPGLAALMYRFIELTFSGKSKEGEELAEVMNLYTEAVNMMIAKRKKKMAKKCGITEELAGDFLVKVPSRGFVENVNAMGTYTHKICGFIYRMSEKKAFTEEQLKDPAFFRNIFEFLFEKDFISNIAINILLEFKDNSKGFKGNQKTVWNTLTILALQCLESYSKKDIKELLAYYLERRENDKKKERDHARRIVLSETVDEKVTPRLYKVVNKLKANEDYAEFV